MFTLSRAAGGSGSKQGTQLNQNKGEDDLVMTYKA